MMDEFFSQYGEDKWIATHCTLPSAGFFVDIGAADGVRFSNSLYFEKRGWTGLCIEPDDRSFERLASSRRCKIDQRAVGLNAGRFPFVRDCDPHLSGFLRRGSDVVSCLTATLTTILQEHACPSQIDLLSIDTEGTELMVWQSLDLSRFRPRFVVIEFFTRGIRESSDDLQETIQLLAEDSYAVLHTTFSNLILIDRMDSTNRREAEGNISRVAR